MPLYLIIVNLFIANNWVYLLMPSYRALMEQLNPILIYVACYILLVSVTNVTKQPPIHTYMCLTSTIKYFMSYFLWVLFFLFYPSHCIKQPFVVYTLKIIKAFWKDRFLFTLLWKSTCCTLWQSQQGSVTSVIDVSFTALMFSACLLWRLGGVGPPFQMLHS